MPSKKKIPLKTRKPHARKGPLLVRHETWKNAFDPAITTLVIRPRLLEVARLGVTSIADFRKKFQAHFTCTVPSSTFRDWLRQLNFDTQFTSPRHVHLDTSPTTLSPVVPQPHNPRLPPTDPLAVLQQDPDPMGGDDPDFRFDNEKPGFEPPAPIVIDDAAVDLMLSKDPTLQHLVLG